MRRTIHNTRVICPNKEWAGDFILLPYGYGYNINFLKARMGDEIRFLGGERKIIHSIQKVSIEDELIQSLCLMRYGMPLSSMIILWKESAKYSGYGSKAVSDTECLFVCYGEKRNR